MHNYAVIPYIRNNQAKSLMKLFQRLAAFDCKQKRGRCSACGKGAARMLCGVKNPDFLAAAAKSKGAIAYYIIKCRILCAAIECSALLSCFCGSLAGGRAHAARAGVRTCGNHARVFASFEVRSFISIFCQFEKRCAKLPKNKKKFQKYVNNFHFSAIK